MGEINWGQTGINYSLFAPVGAGQQGNAFSDMAEQQQRRAALDEQRRQFDATHGLEKQKFGLSEQRFGLETQKFGLERNDDARKGEMHKLDTKAKQNALDEQGYSKLAAINDVVQSASTPAEQAQVLDFGTKLGMDMSKYSASPNHFRLLQEGMKRRMAEEDMKRAQALAATDKTKAEANKDNAQSRLYDAQAANQDQNWIPHPQDSSILVNKKTGDYKKIEDVNPQGKVTPGYRANSDGTWEAIQGGPADIKTNEKRQQDFAAMQSMFQSMDNMAKEANALAAHKGLAGNFGLSGVVPNIPGSAAANAWADMQTLKTKTAFGTLQDMRNSSKTGGALGAVSDRENKMLGEFIASLEKEQSYENVVANLQKIIAFTEQSKARIAAAYNDHWNKKGEEAKKIADPKAPTLGSTPPTSGRNISTPPVVTTEEEMRRLPSGTIYIAPDKSMRQVP